MSKCYGLPRLVIHCPVSFPEKKHSCPDEHTEGFKNTVVGVEYAQELYISLHWNALHISSLLQSMNIADKTQKPLSISI